MPSLSTKERTANFNNNDLIFRKKFNLHSGTLLSAESLADKSKQTVDFSNLPKKTFPLTPSRKYVTFREFNDEFKSLKINLVR